MARIPSALLRDFARARIDAVPRRPALTSLALRAAGARGLGIAFHWHRLGTEAPTPDEVVPTVPTPEFAAQLDLLLELGDVVPLAALEVSARSTRPRFALSFDDDDPGHTRFALPALRERGLPATFFLSGRWLHGHGPYWWEILERDIRADGLAAVAQRCGLPADTSAPPIAHAITGTAATDDLAQRGRGGDGDLMDHADAAALVAGGMEIGFHTIDHPLLPTLPDAELSAALQEGRHELAEDLGVPITRFAYPHGGVDERVAAAAEAAGYRSAWTTSGQVLGTANLPLERSRWDISYETPPEARARIIRRLIRGPR